MAGKRISTSFSRSVRQKFVITNQNVMFFRKAHSACAVKNRLLAESYLRCTNIATSTIFLRVLLLPAPTRFIVAYRNALQK